MERGEIFQDTLRVYKYYNTLFTTFIRIVISFIFYFLLF